MRIEECNDRCSYANTEIIERLFKQNRSMILASSHYGNWEWTANICTVIPYDVSGIYKRQSNHLFDKLYIYIRGKYGTIPVLMKHTLRFIKEHTKKSELFALYLVGDQRPIPEDLNYWTTFLNQETPIITGIEKLSKKFNLSVVFLDIDRLKRGYYRITFHLLTDDPRKEASYAITEKYINKVEQMIVKRPEFWLWSHKRWKYNPKHYKPKDIE
jgi:KDO2-lipid IV(A) lauroyltransferase